MVRKQVFGALLVVAQIGVAQTPTVPMAGADTRAVIRLAPARRDNWQCLMRGHLSSLIDSLRLLSTGDYAGAARATEDHYGLAPGGAEYCRESMTTKEASLAAAQLPPAPPPAVPLMFEQMHAAARRFVTEARQAQASHDPTRAWQALAELSGYCNACHAAFRLD